MPRKTYKKTAKDASALSMKERKAVKRIIRNNLELKYYEYNQTALSVTSTGQVNGVPFDIVVGTGDSNRIGDAITLAGFIDFRFTLNVADTSNVIRIICLQWRSQSYGTPHPDVGDVLHSTDYLSCYNHDQRKNYTILYDELFNLNGNGTQSGTTSFPYTTSSIQHHRRRISLKRASKNIHYVGAGGQGQNRLFFLYISDSTVVNHPTITHTTHWTYYDA